MIARNELAYGNLVIGGYNILMHVTGIFDDEVYLDFDGNEGDVWEEKYKDIKPIEITEELLLKIGFKKEYDNICKKYNYGLFVNGCPVTIGTYSNMADRDWSIHIDNKDYETIFSGDIQYIHQLQNAIYFATNAELEIKIISL